MKIVNIYEAKTRLSQLVEVAASGEDIVIARAGRPVARLTRLQKTSRRRRLGLLDGKFRIPDEAEKLESLRRQRLGEQVTRYCAAGHTGEDEDLIPAQAFHPGPGHAKR